jgi:hypothetical protein
MKENAAHPGWHGKTMHRCGTVPIWFACLDEGFYAIFLLFGRERENIWCT